MFKKVLIAEDFDTVNLAVKQTLEAIGIQDIQYAKYCDDALLKIKRALLDNQPFELLISDLSFNQDHRKVTIQSGDELISLAKKEQPNLKIIAYSVEDKSFRVRSLFEKFDINGYVYKNRYSLEQLKVALNTIYESEKKYITPEMAHLLKDNTLLEIDHYDIQLIKQLSNGIAQDKMDARFKELGIEPNSKSTIEKRIGKLKDYFKANNTVHLIAIAKDLDRKSVV